uniref:Putative bacteriophage protein n=1 Tax=Ralstonia pickettii (strain 12D) TaxID=428406 RepID=C6BBS7_RALP1
MSSVANFRQDFPEFGSTTTYPNSSVSFWMGIAVSLVNPDRWGVLTDQGIELVTAHHLVLAQRDQAAAAVGGVPGEVKGPTASKSVDKVSVSYDTGAVALTDSGFWNLTTYGVRFMTIARTMGAGGMQL